MYNPEWMACLKKEGFFPEARKRALPECLLPEAPGRKQIRLEPPLATELAPILDITPPLNVEDLPGQRYKFEYALPNSCLLREGRFQEVSGRVIEVIHPDNLTGTKFKPFSGESTLQLEMSDSGRLVMRSASWPLIDRYLQLHVKTAQMGQTPGGTYLMLDVAYSPLPISLGLLKELLQEIGVKAGSPQQQALLREHGGRDAMNRQQCTKMLFVHGLLRKVMKVTRLLLLGIAIRVADCYGNRRLAGKLSLERLLLIWHVAVQLREPVKLCFPHLYLNESKAMKLPQLNLKGLTHLINDLNRLLDAGLAQPSFILQKAVLFYQETVLLQWIKQGHSFVPDLSSYGLDVLRGDRGVRVRDLYAELIGSPFYALIYVQGEREIDWGDVEAVRSLIEPERRQKREAYSAYHWRGGSYFVPESYRNCSQVREALLHLLQRQEPLCAGVNEEGFIKEVQAEMAAEDARKQLHPLQEAALRAAFHRRILCVTGKSGTGKSSIFIRYLKQLRDRVWRASQGSQDWTAVETRLAGADLGLPASHRSVKLALRILRGAEDEAGVLRELASLRSQGKGKGKGKGKEEEEQLALAQVEGLALTSLRNLQSKSACRHLLITAPTGMAASNLHPLTDGMGETIDMITTCVKYKPGSVHTESIRVLVIEEASCCDEAHLAAILGILPGLQQLVLVFDNNQIGPVGSGWVSRDLHDLLQDGGGVVRFLRNYRALEGRSEDLKQGASALLCAYRAILERKTELLPICTTRLPDDLGSMSVQEVVSRGVLQQQGSFMVAHSPQEQEIELSAKLYCALNAHGVIAQVLSFRNMQCRALNAACFREFYRQEPERHVYMRGQRIVFTKNYYPRKLQLGSAEARGHQRHKRQTTAGYGGARPQMDAEHHKRSSQRVSNGEVWQIGRIEPRTTGQRLCYSHHEEGEAVSLRSTKEVESRDLTRIEATLGERLKWIYVEDVDWMNISSGIAITGNKSQGSQYPVVIVHLGASCSLHLTLNLLYTMCSRCRLRVLIVTDLKREGLLYGELERVILESPRVFRFSGVYRFMCGVDFS